MSVKYISVYLSIFKLRSLEVKRRHTTKGQRKSIISIDVSASDSWRVNYNYDLVVK
jgi:hypothetical protein